MVGCRVDFSHPCQLTDIQDYRRQSTVKQKLSRYPMSADHSVHQHSQQLCVVYRSSTSLHQPLWNTSNHSRSSGSTKFLHAKPLSAITNYCKMETAFAKAIPALKSLCTIETMFAYSLPAFTKLHCKGL